jgi:hypothetical protein
MCWPSAWNSGRARVASSARTRQRDVDQAFSRPGCVGHHRDAIGEEHRLVDGVGDEDDGTPLRGGLVLAPDAQELVLQDEARLRIERRQRLVHQQHVGLVGDEARERRALAHAARELVRIFVFRPLSPTRSIVLRTRCARAAASRPRPAGPWRKPNSTLPHTVCHGNSA